jgi:hypothetical protein
MRTRFAVLALVAAALVPGAAATQESQSLGEVARQQRLQREKEAGDKDGAPKLITNEEIPEHVEDGLDERNDNRELQKPASSRGTKESAEVWKSRILAEKGQIASLQRRMDGVNSSIRFSSVSCSSCMVRNERQVSKQQQVERMQAQLDQEKKSLEKMQETARKQGYGSSVYDP